MGGRRSHASVGPRSEELVGFLNQFHFVSLRGVDEGEAAAIGFHDRAVRVFEPVLGEMESESLEAIDFKRHMCQIGLHLHRPARGKRADLNRLFALQQTIGDARQICIEAAKVCLASAKTSHALNKNQRSFLSLLAYMFGREQAPIFFEAMDQVFDQPIERLEKYTLREWLDDMNTIQEASLPDEVQFEVPIIGMLNKALPIEGMVEMVEGLIFPKIFPNMDHFFHLLAGSVSLCQKEKHEIINRLKKINLKQYDSLVRIFEEEIFKFKSLSSSHHPYLWILCMKHAYEWMNLYTMMMDNQKSSISENFLIEQDPG